MLLQKLWDRVQDKAQFCEWEDINTCLGLETEMLIEHQRRFIK